MIFLRFRTTRAFTVPEMLAVVAIITIIISMLMPSLQQAKKHAITVACASNQRQLTMAWRTYATDTRGRFVESWQGNGGFATGQGTHWYVVVETYYNKDKTLLICPAATGQLYPPGGAGNYATAAHAWKVGNAAAHKGITDRDYGGYGLNNWLENPAIVGTGAGGSRPNDNFIDRLSASGGHTGTPVLGDGVWPDQGWPGESDLVPGSSADPMAYSVSGYMQRFYLDRHSLAVNLSYIDCSTRTVKIANLWSQKWHRHFNVKPEQP